MPDNTAPLQGQFVSTGQAQFIPLRSGAGWMEVLNSTEASALNASHGVEYKWQLGMANNDAFISMRNGAADAMQDTTALVIPGGPVDGFQFIDTSLQTTGPNVAFTEITAGPPPVVSTTSTVGLFANQTIVRLFFQTGGGGATFAEQLAGIDFTVGTVMANTSFELQNMPAIVATTNPIVGNYRIIPFDPIFYPRRRVIASISQAAQAVVTTTVNHGYLVGQQVRFSNVQPVRPGSAAWGMVEINNLVGNIVAVTASTFTVDINTTGFTAFVFPLTANYPFTPAEVIPVGEDTATALNFGVDILSDATVNTAQIGMLLGAGITSPAGTVGQTIFWRAGTSLNV